MLLMVNGPRFRTPPKVMLHCDRIIRILLLLKWNTAVGDDPLSGDALNGSIGGVLCLSECGCSIILLIPCIHVGCKFPVSMEWGAIQSIPRSRVRLNSLDLSSVGTHSRSGSRERSCKEEPNRKALSLSLLAEFNSFKHVEGLGVCRGPPAYPMDRGRVWSTSRYTPEYIK